MGYYSDVAVGMSFEDKGSLAAFLSYVRLGDKMSPEELAHYTVTDAGEPGVLLHARFLGVKWYESYPDVKCHINLMSMARDSGAGTAFVSIGEEPNDITVEIDSAEVSLDLYDFFGVIRQLNSPVIGTTISEFTNANKE
jgi:hypothetical protein